MTEYAYITADVFTDRRFGGNQLAVLPDARGLDTETMQAITREFAYAESAFVFPPRDPANTAQVRIFTPGREIPFAGHPNVGTAFVLATLGEVFGKPVGSDLIFEEGVGPVKVEVTRSGGRVVNANVTAPTALQRLGEADVGLVAECVGLGAGDILTSRHLPTVGSVGMSFVFAELRDSACVVRSVPDVGRFAARLPVHGADGLMVYARTGPRTLHARMFAPSHGIIEDAATGSAGAALTALLAALDPADDLDFALDIHQGAEMGRPSLMKGGATKRKGQVTAARIGGPCVAVMKGRIHLD